eukprot:CAMPEP_0115498610 /NCGR_PEP_ID=MMETSP0271-20121206/66888_1 /TAXON_ID=71861 /ORGANISM="Scrippsiella trochoidea, Strain CCMP3099" /LENGTH=57 /DNA_ID=CAMNT_0002927353 /DNA_START=163 /DNA_END=337 /DNA_ORIENTATION=-
MSRREEAFPEGAALGGEIPSPGIWTPPQPPPQSQGTRERGGAQQDRASAEDFTQGQD